MATSALQDILAREPGLATRIDEMTELIPGVPASKENLKTLLEHIIKDGAFHSTGSDDISIVFHVMNPTRKKKALMVKMLGKAEVVRRGD